MATIKYFTYCRKKYASYAEVDDDCVDEIALKLSKLKHVTFVEIQKNNKQMHIDSAALRE